MIIEHVRTVGFKGFDLDEPVPDKVIYCGKNKSGKSTRAGAIAIALFGHIPFSTAGKLPSDILNSFGHNSLVVAVKINGTDFARKFSRTEKGASQVMQIDGKRKSKEEFAVKLDKVGAPRIADVAEFMRQSEAKKIDTLFDLFPNDELAGIDTEIENAKEDVSRLQKKKDGAESTVVRLTNSKSVIELPPGSIAEVQAEVKNIDTQIEDLEKQIKEAEIKEAEEKASKKAEEKLLAKQEEERLANLKKPAEEIVNNNSGGHAFIDGGYPEVEDIFGQISSEEKTAPSDSSFYGNEETMYPAQEITKVQPEIPLTQSEMANKTYAKASIVRIIDALTSVGCNTCAALIVAKQELKKYRGAND